MVIATKKWIFLKISSIILIPLMLWFAVNLVAIYDKDFVDVLIFFTSQPSKLLFSILIVVAYFYSALSISEIFEDYINNEKSRKFANIMLYLSSFIIPIITITILIASLILYSYL